MTKSVKKKRKGKKSEAGRLLFDGKDEKQVLSILRAAFQRGATDEMAVNLAEISVQALYRYEKKHPEFREQKRLWKTSLSFRALNKVSDDIEGNVETAKWYLTRKMPEEFGDKVQNQLSGKIEHEHNFSEIAKSRIKKYVP